MGIEYLGMLEVILGMLSIFAGMPKMLVLSNFLVAVAIIVLVQVDYEYDDDKYFLGWTAKSKKVRGGE